MLSYALQVAELQKIARLEAPRSTGSTAGLGARSASVRCLVCDTLHAAACLGCASVAYCGARHQDEDAPWHQGVCEQLRAAREDAELRAHTPPAAVVARVLKRSAARERALPSSWDTYLGPELSGAERRVASDFASRPLTIARLLDELDLPAQGARRIHVMGATATELLALELYEELAAFFPEASFEVAFVGPQLPSVPLPRFPRVRFAQHVGDYRRALWSTLGTPALIVAFNAGLLLYRSWQPTLFELFRCGAPFVITSYRGWEARAEAQVLASVGGACVRPPTLNPFASLACRRSTTIANDVSFDNSHLSVWRQGQIAG